MKLEFLPNEIFLDLFEYFDAIDLLRVFDGLNSRFSFLLYKQFRCYCLDFESISKRNFDMICQRHLPKIADRVISLRFCGYDDTPQQINLFFSYIPSLRQFTRLEQLRLCNLDSYQMLLKILGECQHLDSLTHLYFISCSCRNRDANFQLIVDNIWSLPKLTRCTFDIEIKEQKRFYVPAIISSSLQYLTICNSKLELNQMNRLFDYTPRLKYLFTSIKSIIEDNYIVSPLPTLIKFIVCLSYEFVASKINVLFRSMPNLRHLGIGSGFELIDGHQWEQIIRNYLLELKTFRLIMWPRLSLDENIEERAERLIDSFRSSFWIDEHQWFVRCFTHNKTIHLNTLSDATRHRKVMFPDSWQSTYPHDKLQDFYNSMTSIDNETLFNQSISSHIRLPNIEELCIKLPVNDQFWAIVPSLNRLSSLTVSFHNNDFQSELQTLLDQAPHLYTLPVSGDESLTFQMAIFECSNASVRRLDLDECEHCFNEEECLTLSRSSLGVQCEVLYIWVDNRETIINLVRNMLNLRSLIVRCADDEYYDQSALEENSENEFSDKEKLINDEVVQWLKDRLPPTYFIARDPEADSLISIWI